MRDDVPLPEEHVGQQPDEEEEQEAVSDEDLAFVQQHSESLGFLKNLDKAELDRWAPCGRCWAGLGSQQEGDDRVRVRDRVRDRVRVRVRDRDRVRAGWQECPSLTFCIKKMG